MIWSAALPGGAALRVMRTAAGRRALHMALLVGGLFVLGVLCGERAQAADETPSLKDTVGQVLDLPAESPRNVVRTVEDRVTEGRVVRPVGDVVETVTEGLGAVARAEVPPLEALPALPSAPSLPVLPSSPPLSVLPDPSGPADPDPRPAPTNTGTGTGTSASTSTAPDTTHEAADASGATGPRDSDGAGDAAHDAYGPAYGGHGGASVTEHVDIHRAVPAPTEHAPAHRAPGGDPDGTLGTTSGADQGTPRQGDAHAVTPHHRIAFRLVPGALVRADTVEPWDRYRDIPVSPA
ncbi:hypothetical protein [Streptomyces sp. AC512_CC834]|uniref:hypothetical protein n=1 Tax=Streptomyces sp. AC512_CC834 TaxID=2823691 RepID=UPI001C252C80|nr:hypothetical protein [Streptomyces sp. AC512_CC834]